MFPETRSAQVDVIKKGLEPVPGSRSLKRPFGGFNLLEVVLTIVVGALLVLGAFVGFQTVFNKAQTETELASLRSMGREAQALLALSGADRWDTQAGLDAVLGAIEDTPGATSFGTLADSGDGLVPVEGDVWPDAGEIGFVRTSNTLVLVGVGDTGWNVVVTPPVGTIHGGTVPAGLVEGNTPTGIVNDGVIPELGVTQVPTTTEPPPTTTTTIPSGSQTFNAQPGAQTFVVPEGVTQINVTLEGGAGAGPKVDLSKGLQRGGMGALVTGTLDVTPGETLDVYAATRGVVGTSGTTNAVRQAATGKGAANGGMPANGVFGGGGGASAIARGQTWLVVAGGGGAGGWKGWCGAQSWCGANVGGNGGENAPEAIYSSSSAPGGKVGTANMLSDGQHSSAKDRSPGGGGWSGGTLGSPIGGSGGSSGGGGGGNLVPAGGTAGVASGMRDGSVVISWG